MTFLRFIENIVHARRYESVLEGRLFRTLALLCQRNIVKYVTVSARMCVEELEFCEIEIIFSKVERIIEYRICIFVARARKNMHVNPLAHTDIES